MLLIATIGGCIAARRLKPSDQIRQARDLLMTVEILLIALQCIHDEVVIRHHSGIDPCQRLVDLLAG